MADTPERLAAALEGRYTIERELGEGGMAVVYLADDLKHERKVALKVLKPELAAVVGGERFVSEIRTTANLQHPHILPLFDSGEADGFLFYVMPYVEGETLRDRLDREKQLPVQEAVAITTKIARALQTAHDQGVIHRDIKPANILLQKGEPVVSDFGIALAVQEAGGGRLTETGLSLGTPYYMSPEQATADRDPDARSDLYSLACLTYEMLAGEPPFTGSSAQAVLGRILTQAPPHVSAERSSVPHNVDAAILQALQKVPADRFGSVAEFADALNDLAYMGPAGRTSGAVPEVAARGAAADRRWRSGMLWPIGAIAVAAVAVLLLRPAPDDPKVWRLDIDTRSLDPPEVFVGFTPAISPDGGTIAVAAVVDERPGIYVRDRDEAEFRFVPNTEGGFAPTFSPDGEWIAFAHDDGSLRKVTLAGAGRTLLLDVDTIQAFNPHWGTPDRIVITGPDGIFLVSATSGAIEDVERVASAGVYDPHLLPDGSGVVASGDAGDEGIRLLDLARDTLVRLLETGSDPVYVEPGYLLYTSSDGGLFASRFELGALETTGTPIRLMDGIAGAVKPFAVSGNGHMVYLEGPPESPDDTDRVMTTSLSDGAYELLPLPEGNYSEMAWSPDGAYLAMAVEVATNDGFDIYTWDLQRQDLERLTTSASAGSPVWSPDGEWIVFSDGGSTHLHVVPADGSADPIDLGEETARIWPTDWIDGDRILGDVEGDGTGDVGVVQLERDSTGWRVAEVRPYLTVPYLVWDAAVSPDGDWAVFSSERTGAEEVWIASFPDPTAQYQVSNRDGSVGRPHWSADGSAVLFASQNNGRDTLYSASIERNPARPRAPTLLLDVVDLDSNTWSVSPDGTRIVMGADGARLGRLEEAGAADDPSALEDLRVRWRYVVNWRTEFERKLAEAGR